MPQPSVWPWLQQLPAHKAVGLMAIRSHQGDSERHGERHTHVKSPRRTPKSSGGTSAGAQKAGGQDPFSSLVERLEQIWTGEPTNPDLHYDAIVRLSISEPIMSTAGLALSIPATCQPIVGRLGEVALL